MKRTEIWRRVTKPNSHNYIPELMISNGDSVFPIVGLPIRVGDEKQNTITLTPDMSKRADWVKIIAAARRGRVWVLFAGERQGRLRWDEAIP